MSTPYTHEEREMAAGQVAYFSPSFTFNEIMSADGDEIENVAVNLQMQLNRLMERDREARELLKNAQPMNAYNYAVWFDRKGAWLSEEDV